MSNFDKILRQEHWNTDPQQEIKFRTSDEPLLNCALALSLCAYPQSHQIENGGKASKYYFALLSYIMRASRLEGYTKDLPDWTKRIPTRNLQGILDTGLIGLMRTLTVRGVIYSGLIKKLQSEKAKRQERATFLLTRSADLKSMKIEIPLEQTPQGNRLVGKILKFEPATIRQTIIYHLPALRPHLGASLSTQRDDEADYQNIYNRYFLPVTKILPIADIVHQQAEIFQKEGVERNMAIDQLLMRKAEWGRDLANEWERRRANAIHVLRQIGVPACACHLVQLSQPECTS